MPLQTFLVSAWFTAVVMHSCSLRARDCGFTPVYKNVAIDCNMRLSFAFSCTVYAIPWANPLPEVLLTALIGVQSVLVLIQDLGKERRLWHRKHEVNIVSDYLAARMS